MRHTEKLLCVSDGDAGVERNSPKDSLTVWNLGEGKVPLQPPNLGGGASEGLPALIALTFLVNTSLLSHSR